MLQLLIFWNAPIFDLRTFSFNMRFATDINVGRKIRYHLCLYYGKDGFRRKNCTPLSTRKVNICTAVIKITAHEEGINLMSIYIACFNGYEQYNS